MRKLTKVIASERRRKRYPVPADNLPPFACALGTHLGIVIFTRTPGEWAASETVADFYSLRKTRITPRLADGPVCWRSS